MAAVLWMMIPDDRFIVPSFKLEAFSWDVVGHINGLASSEFSPATFTRLAAFFNS